MSCFQTDDKARSWSSGVGQEWAMHGLRTVLVEPWSSGVGREILVDVDSVYDDRRLVPVSLAGAYMTRLAGIIWISA